MMVNKCLLGPGLQTWFGRPESAPLSRSAKPGENAMHGTCRYLESTFRYTVMARMGR